jgi:hypothetical protein
MWKLMTKPNCMRDRKTGSSVVRAAVIWPPILAERKRLLFCRARMRQDHIFLVHGTLMLPQLPYYGAIMLCALRSKVCFA